MVSFCLFFFSFFFLIFNFTLKTGDWSKFCGNFVSSCKFHPTDWCEFLWEDFKSILYLTVKRFPPKKL
jgi:hypothetical protein